MKILELIQQNYSYALTLAIIHSLWQSILVIAVITGMGKLKIFKRPDKKYFLYVAGLLTLFISFLTNIGLALGSSATMVDLGIPAADVVLSNINHYIVETSGVFLSVHEIVAALWMSGVLIFFVKYFLGNIFLTNIKRNGLMISDRFDDLVEGVKAKLGIKKHIGIIQSDKISIPITMGFLKPIVVFPMSYFTQLTPAQFEAILIHELVHIKRNDYLINQIQSVVECIMFFNPFAWYMSMQIRKYREYHCDDMVQSQIEDKRIYLKALYKVARFSGMTDHTSVALFNNKSELVMRVKRMLNQKTEDHTYKPFFSLTLFALLFFGVVAFGNNQTSNLENELKSTVEEFVNMTVEVPAIEISEFLGNDKPFTKAKAQPKAQSKPQGLLIKEKVNAQLKNKVEEHEARNEAFAKILPKLRVSSTQLVQNSKDIHENYSIQRDTVPDEKKIKELELRIEEKALEMEELSRNLETKFEHKFEIDAQKIEELALKLEQRISQRAEEIDASLNNPEMVEKIEKLVQELEMRIEAEMSGLEELESEKIQLIEKKMEEIAAEMEKYVNEDGEITNESKMSELKKRMHEQGDLIRKIVSEYTGNHQKILDNVDIKNLKEQIHEMTKELSALDIKREQLMDPITQQIHEEIQVLQEQMQQNIKPIHEEMRKALELKAKEIQQLAKELEEERRKGKNK